MKRTLTLNEDDLIMVIDKDIVQQIDESRGEMNRTEFTNFLIHSQLKKHSMNQNYIDKEEFHRVVQEIKEFLRNFLDFFLSMELGKQSPDSGFEEWLQKIQALGSSENKAEKR